MLEFRKNRNHLLQYCLYTVLIFLSLDLALLFWRGVSFELTFGRWDFLWIVAGLLLCGLPSSILHNCAHGNTGGPRINRAIGEACGTLMLYGFESFRTGHMLHHRFPDNPDYDPHPPRGISFGRFLVSPVEATLTVIEKVYYETHGTSERTARNIRWQKGLFKLGLALKVAFWFLLLGPKVFVLFYLPLYVSNLFVFAHINYATHIEDADGQSQIVNLNHNLYYRVANWLSLGGYFHKNHHLRPKAFNPSRIALLPLKPLLTFRVPTSSLQGATSVGAQCR